MIALIIACAGLCGLTLSWVFRPLRTPRAFYALSFLCALLTLGLYLLMGRPDLPATHVGRAEIADRRELMRQEFEFMVRLEKNPDDADALIRLAAIHVLQNRLSPETMEMLDRADALKPGDRRIKFIRSMIKNPNPVPEKN